MTLVSINCITYNHEKFIGKAIESFLMQQTDFEYEILIHDDASIDQTAEIIRDYQKLYPDIIKPIFQTENQYSKGVKFGSIFHINDIRAKGKYIARCEGDDYWTDPSKLQKQVNYMENNSDCMLCFHNANIVNEDDDIAIQNLMIDKNVVNRKYSAGELAILGFIPTASQLFRNHAMSNPPDWYFTSIVADFPSQLIITSHGYAYYINEVMSNYRYGTSGSASEKFNRKNTKEKVKYISEFIRILNNFNDFTSSKYFNEIDQAKLKFEIKIIEQERNFRKFREKRFINYYKSLTFKDKTKLYIRSYMPNLYLFISNINSSRKNK